MAENTVQGVVLRRRDAGESDRRITLLTPTLGKLDVVAKGARKAASRLAGVSEPLNVASFALASGKKNSFVTQAQPLSSFRRLRSDFDRLSFGLALVEAYAAIVPYEQPDAELYLLLVQSLQALELHSRPVVAFVWSATAFLAHAGFQSQYEGCVVCGNTDTLPDGVLSPKMGGFLCLEHRCACSDAFLVMREVRIGLGRISHLPEPPDNLKFSQECLFALLPFMRYVAEAPLPANEAVVRMLREQRLQ